MVLRHSSGFAVRSSSRSTVAGRRLWAGGCGPRTSGGQGSGCPFLTTSCSPLADERGNRRNPKVPIPADLTSVGGGRINHDFFSGSGFSYVIGKAENTQDEDWDF